MLQKSVVAKAEREKYHFVSEAVRHWEGPKMIKEKKNFLANLAPVTDGGSI